MIWLYLLYLILDMLYHRYFIFGFHLLLWHVSSGIQVHFEATSCLHGISRWHACTWRHWAGDGGLVQLRFLENWLLITHEVVLVIEVLVVDRARGFVLVLLYRLVGVANLDSGESGWPWEISNGCAHFYCLFVKLWNFVPRSRYLRRPWILIQISCSVGCGLQLPVISPLWTESIVVAGLQPAGQSLQHGHVSRILSSSLAAWDETAVFCWKICWKLSPAWVRRASHRILEQLGGAD